MAAAPEGPILAVDVIRRLEHAEDGDAPRLPSIMETLSHATVLGSVERAERNSLLADVVVTPDAQSIGLRELGAIERAVALGRAAAADALAAGAAERLEALLRARLAG